MAAARLSALPSGADTQPYQQAFIFSGNPGLHPASWRTCDGLAMQHLHHAVVAPHHGILAGQHTQLALWRPCSRQA